MRPISGPQPARRVPPSPSVTANTRSAHADDPRCHTRDWPRTDTSPRATAALPDLEPLQPLRLDVVHIHPLDLRARRADVQDAQHRVDGIRLALEPDLDRAVGPVGGPARYAAGVGGAAHGVAEEDALDA